ncbi:MAG: nucleotidyl transferase [Desulfobacterales bacterium]|nr:MAG: nucleotidyl transferase [Desulfobacterales bacterium]
MQAMILAAGFGTRLKPYSLCRPKPLFPVLNKPFLAAVIDRIKKAGCETIVVNTHHLQEQFRLFLSGIDGVILQEEETILGTGGGLRKAVTHLQSEPLLVTNGDIYHTIDFRNVIEEHGVSGCDITMVLHDFPRFNTVSVREADIVGFDGEQGRQYAYTGIQVVNPLIINEIPLDSFSCIIDYYRRLLRQGVKIRALIVDQIHWCDMGTPADYLMLHEALLAGSMPVWPELEVKRQLERIVVDEYARLGEGICIDGWACIGNADIGANTKISRSIIWDGSVIAPGSVLTDCIVTPDQTV